MKPTSVLNLCGLFSVSLNKINDRNILRVGIPRRTWKRDVWNWKLMVISIVATLGTASIAANAVNNSINHWYFCRRRCHRYGYGNSRWPMRGCGQIWRGKSLYAEVDGTRNTDYLRFQLTVLLFFRGSIVSIFGLSEEETASLARQSDPDLCRRRNSPVQSRFALPNGLRVRQGCKIYDDCGNHIHCGLPGSGLAISFSIVLEAWVCRNLVRTAHWLADSGGHYTFGDVIQRNGRDISSSDDMFEVDCDLSVFKNRDAYRPGSAGKNILTPSEWSCSVWAASVLLSWRHCPCRIGAIDLVDSDTLILRTSTGRLSRCTRQLAGKRLNVMREEGFDINPNPRSYYMIHLLPGKSQTIWFSQIILT